MSFRSVLERNYTIEASAGREENIRGRYFPLGYGQSREMAGEIWQAGTCEVVEEKMIPANLIGGTETHQTRQSNRTAVASEKITRMNRRETMKVHVKEDFQFQKWQWKIGNHLTAAGRDQGKIRNLWNY